MIGVYIHTIVSRILIIIVMIFALIPVMAIICLPRKVRFRSKTLFWVIHWFYKATLWATLVPVRVRGQEHVPTRPAIFVANHQSSLDVPLIGSLVGGAPHMWIARSELMESWLLKTVLPRLAEVVEVDSPRKAMRSLLTVLKTLNNSSTHLMIFPEGQRFIDGEIHEFFGGFVMLARKTGRPVIPVYIAGVNTVYPPNSFLVYWHPIEVVVGPPFIVNEHENDELFKQRVYNWFVQQVKEQQG